MGRGEIDSRSGILNFYSGVITDWVYNVSNFPWLRIPGQRKEKYPIGFVLVVCIHPPLH